MPGERGRRGGRRRRQRLAGRDRRSRPRPPPRRAGGRGREPWPRRELEHRHPRDAEPLRAPPERRRLAPGRGARSPRRLRGHAPACGGRRAAPAERGRHAAALRAGLPDPLAPRHGVLLPAQARPGHERAQRVLCGGLRPRPGARGGGGHGGVHARAAGRGRRGRPARRGLLPLQRGNRLVLPVPAGRLGGRVLSRRGVRPRRGRRARRPPLRREPARPPALPGQAPGPCDGRARTAAAARRAAEPQRGALFRGGRGRVYREAAGWLSSGSADELLRR